MENYQFEKLILDSKRELPSGNFSLNQKNVSFVGKIIANAINRNQKIAIYGDYDADGISTSAMMREFLNDVSEKVNKAPQIDITISTRYSSGYGMSIKKIKELTENYALIIGIDHGANSDFLKQYDEIFEGKSKMVIFDHHLSDNDKYEFIVNPATDGVFGISSGIVVKKFIDYFLSKTKIDIDAKKYSDLETLTIISDMATLTNYTRKRLKEGLKQINKKKRFSFKSNAGEIKHKDLSFGVISKINAVGRMRDNVDFVADWLVESKNYNKWKNQTILIDSINDEKKRLINKYFNIFLLQSEKEKNENDNIGLYVTDEIPIGLNGLIAQKLFQHTNRETIVLSLHDGEYKGSGRGFDIYDTLKNIQEAMNIGNSNAFKFGGHSAAIGMSITKEKLDDFSFHILHSQPKTKKEVNIIDSITVSQFKEFSQVLSDITGGIPLDKKFYFSLEDYNLEDLKRFKSNFASVRLSDDDNQSVNFFLSFDIVKEESIRSGKPLKVAIDELFDENDITRKSSIEGVLSTKKNIQKTDINMLRAV